MAASVANSRKILTSGASVGSNTANPFTSVTGDTIYVVISDASGQSGVTITDNKGNNGNYAQVGTTQTSALGGSQIRRFACQNANGGSGHIVTITWAANSDAVAVVYDLTGVAAASLDKSAQADDSSSPWTVTSPTLSQADEIAITFTSGSWSGTFSESTGFTIDQQEGNNSLYWTAAAASKVVSATTALTPSWSVSGGGSGSAVTIDTFMAAAAGGGGITGAGQIASSEAIGSAGVAATVSPAAIGSGEAFGSAAIGAGISTAGIASGQAIGQPAVGAAISTTGIPSAEAFGLPVVAPSGIVASGIASAEAFGQPAISARIDAAGVGSGEAVGQPVVGTPVISTRMLGFEIGARTVSFKPLLQRVLEEKYPRVKPSQERARKRAKAIEVQGAEITLNGSATESKLRELAAMWIAERPVMPTTLGQVDPMAVYLAQVAFRIRQQQDEQQLMQAIAAKRRKDDDEAALLLLLA